jgi:hypothetical protein
MIMRWITGALFALLLVPAAEAAPPSRADYAEQCAAEMGRIPTFNCLNGELLDITVNGVPQSAPVPSGTCDKPVGLGLAGNQCVPFSRLLTLDTGKPNVTTIAICRKYLASNGPQDSRFDDIAMIQHDKQSGRTCFFQSHLEANLDGKDVPSPSDRSDRASHYWQENEDGGVGPGSVPCTSCHGADPFIWSPFVAQKADLGRWNPNGKYDSNFAGVFGRPTQIFEPANSACVVCHRFGRGPANTFSCELFVRRYTGNQPHAVNSSAFQMPLGFSGSANAWHSNFDAAVAQIGRCCENPQLAECRSRPATGDPVPPFTPPPNIAAILQYLEQEKCGSEGGCNLSGVTNYVLQ